MRGATRIRKIRIRLRAVAATLLAHDPDPRTGRALVKAALNDKDWIVRAAAVEAVAQRGDPTLEEKIEISLFDRQRSRAAYRGSGRHPSEHSQHIANSRRRLRLQESIDATRRRAKHPPCDLGSAPAVPG